MNIVKSYLKSYQGLSLYSWQRIFLSFINSIANGTVYYLSLYFYTKLNFPTPVIGLLLSFFGIGTMVGSFVSGYLCDRLDSNKISTLFMFINALSLLILLNFHSLLFIIIDLFAMGTANFGFVIANTSDLLKNKTTIKNKLQIISLLRTVNNLSLGIAVLMGGFIFQMIA